MQDLMRLFWFIFADPHWLVGSLLGWPVDVPIPVFALSTTSRLTSHASRHNFLPDYKVTQEQEHVCSASFDNTPPADSPEVNLTRQCL